MTHIERSEVDYPRAAEQWLGYVEVLRATGWQVEEVESSDDWPDAVFIEDTIVVFGDFAVIARPGAEQRRPEVEGAERAIASHVRRVAHITAPATLDGGDVLKVGSTVYVGLSDRTNQAGVDQLTALLPDRTVVAVPVTKVLHLKSAVTALPDGTVIGHEPLVDDSTMFERFLGVPEESGSAVVDLGEGRLLMADDCPESVALIESRGYDVVTVAVSEFQKLEGCVTCLSVRVRS